MEGFKKFLLRGNLVELAVAFIIGVAFAAVVKSFSDLVLATIAWVFGGNPDFTDWVILETDDKPGIPVGVFVTTLISFLILATVVYFFVVMPYEKAKERFAKKVVAEHEDALTAEVALLTEIRDALTNRPT